VKKEILNLLVNYIEIKVQCGYSIKEDLIFFKNTSYKNIDIKLLKEKINWFIDEYALENEKFKL
jgi:hypothetical protein